MVMLYKKNMLKSVRTGACKIGLRLVFFGVVAMIVCACSENAFKPDERLVAAFVEMRVVEQLYGETPEARLARRDILAKYGYSREDFIKEVEIILDDGKRWMPFEAAVSERIDSLLGIPKAKPIPQKGGK